MSGLNLPEPPEKPLSSDCCNSGCSPCILDVYEDLMKQWEEKCELIKSGVQVFISEEESSSHAPVLLPNKYTTFKIVSITALSEDTNLYCFQAVEKVSGPDQETIYRELNCKLDFKPTQHFMLQGNEKLSDDVQYFTRAYTPISGRKLSRKGCFHVVIKLYPDGKMSNYVKKLSIGDMTFWRGPYGGFSYKANAHKSILMLCAGTGVAPMYSLSESIVNNEDDETTIKMFFCCKDGDSILLRKEIHALRSYWNFSADIYVSHNKTECKALYGETLKAERLNQDSIKSELHKKNVNDTMVLICGSPQFCKEMDQFVRNCCVDPLHIHIF